MRATERLWSRGGRLTGALGIGSALLLACGGPPPPTEADLAYAAALRPGTELATTPGEEQALARAATLPDDEAVTLGSQSFVAGPLYVAASGRRCRQLTVDGARERLVCEDLSAGGWVFVPDIFAGGSR